MVVFFSFVLLFKGETRACRKNLVVFNLTTISFLGFSLGFFMLLRVKVIVSMHSWGTQNHQKPCFWYLKNKFFGGENLWFSWFGVLLVGFAKGLSCANPRQGGQRTNLLYVILLGCFPTSLCSRNLEISC